MVLVVCLLLCCFCAVTLGGQVGHFFSSSSANYFSHREKWSSALVMLGFERLLALWPLGGSECLRECEVSGGETVSWPASDSDSWTIKQSDYGLPTLSAVWITQRRGWRRGRGEESAPQLMSCHRLNDSPSLWSGLSEHWSTLALI